jgi:hypothetical protein
LLILINKAYIAAIGFSKWNNISAVINKNKAYETESGIVIIGKGLQELSELRLLMTT